MKRNFRRGKEKKSQIGMIISNHIINNRKDYLIASAIFLIGLLIGIMFINYLNESDFNNVNNYIKELIINMQTADKLNFSVLLKNSITLNIILIFVLWISASTIIGIPIVYGIIAFRGFTLGYTISSIISTVGIWKGILFILPSMFLHNIIFIPVFLAASVSGMKLYHSIVKNKQRDNLKIEFLRHTIFCVIMLIFLCISSLIETYISTNFAKLIVKYIKI